MLARSGRTVNKQTIKGMRQVQSDGQRQRSKSGNLTDGRP